MKLLSATVRAYRLHRETKMLFDASRTLIGGPNESGKSTFAEAIHRALFLKAKGNTVEHRAMKSTVHQGSPEVELSFESGGAIYQLKKRFGSSGDTTLTPPQGIALTGEAAETELARLLGVGAAPSGKMALGQWSHLWVWQGQSAQDPTAHVNNQRDNLFQKLQTLGGAAAMQSARDSRTAAAVSAAYDEIYTSSGKLKASSPLAAALLALGEAEVSEAAARDRQKALIESAAAFREAETMLTQLGQQSAILSAQQAQALIQEALIRQRLEEEALQLTTVQSATAKRDTLEKQEAQLCGLRHVLGVLESELSPLDLTTESLTQKKVDSQQLATVAGQSFEVASGASAQARQQCDLLQAWLQQDEAETRLAGLTECRKQVIQHQTEAEKLRLALAALPPVDREILATLQKLDAARHAAEAALTVMAAGVELLSGEVSVLLGEVKLERGETRILTEEAELKLGSICSLRIRPGGGISLAQARERGQLTRRQCVTALEKYGVRSLEEGTVFAARRADLTSRLLVEEASLTALKAPELPAALSKAQADLTTAQATTARWIEMLSDDPLAALVLTPQTARTALGEAAQRLSEAESTAARCKTHRAAATRAAEADSLNLLKHQDSLRERQLRRTGLLAQLDLLLVNHGSDESRAEALGEARRQEETVTSMLAETRRLLAELQPEHAARHKERLQRSLEALQSQRSTNETKRAVAVDQLRFDGTLDPVAALALATARLLEIQETTERLQRQADARGLLHRAFGAEQAALAERFTQPLADRISGYLECLFGPGTRASVVLKDQEFTGLEIQRLGQLGGAFPFDALSGGTREQCAAAVRLAMAEVLAADHNGTLPILFDDAFTYSDVARLSQLQNMLDLAAARGLQVIVLTHQAGSYVALGAKIVSLS